MSDQNGSSKKLVIMKIKICPKCQRHYSINFEKGEGEDKSCPSCSEDEK